MASIMTALGPISPEDLGFTSMHEHILGDGSFYREKLEAVVPKQYRGMWDDPVSMENRALHIRIPVLTRDNMVLDDVELMSAEVADFREAGGSSIVEVSPTGLRLKLPEIRRISQETGVHVVVSTGFYLGDSWPAPFQEMPVEDLTAHMVREVEEGIDDTGIKAGHIKQAVENLTAVEERGLRAGARAALQTGLPVSVHPGFGIGDDGRRIASILIQEGMEPGRIILSHSDGYFVERSLRTRILNPGTWGLYLDYHQELLDRGVNLSIDCFGHNWFPEGLGEIWENDWQRLGGLVALLQQGYSGQIVLGTDTFAKVLTRRRGGAGYRHLLEWVVPTLRELGVSDYDIRQMTIENPARLLSC